MKYEYCGISLGDDIKDIISKFNISKIKYEKDLKYLSFKLGKTSQKTNLESFISIPIKIGKVIYIIIFDENFKLFNELEIWQELTDEIKKKYELYYDEEDESIYLSKKYKYLKIGVDEGYGRIEGFKDYKERIFSFIFDAQEDICWILQQDKITNYLECKNLQDIYDSLYDSKTLDVDIEKREIYGQLDNYKFIFSLLTRDIKSIQNLETGEFIKTSLEQIEIKISLKFLILKAIQIENIYIAFSIVDPRLDIIVVFEGASEDLGYRVKVIFTDPSNSPQLIGVDENGNTYIKDGTAYVDKKTGIGYILVNTESPANSTKAGVIGTIAEEQSHIIEKKEGRQKVVPDGSEKGLESLGKPTNDYFKKQYSKNDKVIGIKSDGKDYSNVDFGENVGDDLDSFEEDQYYNINGYKKDNGGFKVIATPKKGESELEAITNGRYKIKETDDFLYSKEEDNLQIIEELSGQAKVKSEIDPYNNYIVGVSREEGLNIIEVPKAKSWKENQSNDFHEAVRNLAKSNKKVAENWKNGKYLSAVGNGIIGVLNVPNLIQTGAGSTIADLAYSFDPGEVQFGKRKDILGRRGANKAKAKVTTDLFLSIVAASVTPNKIGGGNYPKYSLELQPAQSIIAAGDGVTAIAGTGYNLQLVKKVKYLEGVSTGPGKGLMIASAVGSSSKDSEKNDKNNTEKADSKKLKLEEKKKQLEEQRKSFEEISRGKPTQIDTRNIGAKETSKNAVEIKVTKDKMKEIEKIAKEGDPSGVKTEKLFDSVLKDQPNVKVYDGKVGSNNGFDHVYVITDDKGVIKEVWIVDSKQMGSTKRLKEGAIKLNNNAAKLNGKSTRQLSPDWIEANSVKLGKEKPIVKIIKEAEKNGTLRIGVAAVNKETKKLIVVELKVKNKQELR